MRYCSTWLRSLLCYMKKFVIEEFVIRVFHCILQFHIEQTQLDDQVSAYRLRCACACRTLRTFEMAQQGVHGDGHTYLQSSTLICHSTPVSELRRICVLFSEQFISISVRLEKINIAQITVCTTH